MEKADSGKKEKKVTKNLKYLLLAVFLAFILIAGLLTIGGILLLRGNSAVREYVTEIVRGDGSEKSLPQVLTVTEKERNTITIVQENQESVVSIAVSKIVLKQGEGVVNSNSKIGTGFIVDESGIVITNQHVVSDLNADYKVVSNDGVEFAVSKIIRDDLSDIALLRIDKGDKEIKAVELGDSDNLLVGQDVIAIGTPLGEYAGSVTTGIVSGLDRTVTAGSGWFGSTSKTYEGVIQTDAAINPGNSGGPLINSQGQVVGVNFATTSGVDNISFALPINRVKNRLEEYRTYGKFIRPYLGVTYQMISEYEALYYKDVVPGALVVRIDPVSPAYTAGIRKGDFIVEFAGEEVKKPLGELIQKKKVGESVDIKVSREGKEMKFTVKLGEME